MWERAVCNRYKNISPCLPTGRGKKSQITILAFQQGNVGSSYKTPTHYLVENKINVLLHTVVCSQNHHIESNLANRIEMGKMHLDGPNLICNWPMYTNYIFHMTNSILHMWDFTGLLLFTNTRLALLMFCFTSALHGPWWMIYIKDSPLTSLLSQQKPKVHQIIYPPQVMPFSLITENNWNNHSLCI